MNLHIFNIILGVIAAVGIPGAIALAVFAPAAAEVVFSILLKIIGKILGTRLGLGICVGLGCLILGELYGTHQANLTCRATIVAKEKAADDAATKRDDQQAAIRSTEDQDYITKLESNNKTSEDQINAYIKELATRKSSACLLDSSDIGRLYH